MDTKRFQSPLKLLGDGAPGGSVEAVFSTLNVRDLGDDVALKSFFTDGQEVAMAPWGHDWGALPPGKGVIRVDDKTARFVGAFFTDTLAGQEHHKTVKNMGGLQEWSFGLNVIESHQGDFDDGIDRPVRFLEKGEVFEVSPVLIGMNRDTYTVGIKSNQPFADQLNATLAVVESMARRAQSLADLRGEKGRTLSDRYREQLAKALGDLRQLTIGLDLFLKSQEPRDEPDLTALFARIEHTLDAAQLASLEA